MLQTAISILKEFLARWLRRDGLVMLLLAAVTVVMTYPLVLHLTGDWVPSDGQDVYIKLWDIWWLDRVIRTGQDPFFTRSLFHPDGLNLAFHSMSWTASILGWLLVPLTGSILSAYKVTVLIGLFAAAYGGYLLILELTGDRAASWFGALVYGFAPFLMAHSGSHPDVAQIATIPIATLLLIRALRQKSYLAALGAAAAVGLSAFTSMYNLVFVALTLSFVFLVLAAQSGRWRDGQFWRVTLVFAIATLLLLAARFYPWLMNLEELTGTLNDFYRPAEFQADLLAYFTPSVEHALLGRFVEDFAENFGRSRGQPPYLGFIPILLLLSALTWKRHLRDVWPWLVIGLFFFLLSLGSVLRFNGQHLEQVPLLLPYLDWFTPLRGVRTNFYRVGLLLPLAVCSAYGLLRWLEALKDKTLLKYFLVGMLSTLLLFEYWNGPYPILEQPINHFFTDLAEDTGDQAIIELPMGRNRSKLYLYFQTAHGLPTAEGASGRTPNEAYGYIDQNELLSLWRSTTALDCNKISSKTLINALDRLISDDFRYVIIHNTVSNETFTSYFTGAPLYTDEDIFVYDLLELSRNPPCSYDDVPSG